RRSRSRRARPVPRDSRRSPSPPRQTGRCWWRPWRSGSAAPTSRSPGATTAGRRPGGTAWSSATSPSGACSRHRPAPGWRRGRSSAQRVLVTGAGPIGLLAALLGTQRGLDVHVLDVVSAGPKPELVVALGATYHHGDLGTACAGADVVIECTGVGQLVFDAM